jgi:hypothetical protein
LTPTTWLWISPVIGPTVSTARLQFETACGKVSDLVPKWFQIGGIFASMKMNAEAALHLVVSSEGPDRAFEVTHEDLFIARYEQLLSWAGDLTEGDSDRAEDLVQDAFIRYAVRVIFSTHTAISAIRLVLTTAR